MLFVTHVFPPLTRRLATTALPCASQPQATAPDLAPCHCLLAAVPPWSAAALVQGPLIPSAPPVPAPGPAHAASPQPPPPALLDALAPRSDAFPAGLHCEKQCWQPSRGPLAPRQPVSAAPFVRIGLSASTAHTSTWRCCSLLLAAIASASAFLLAATRLAHRRRSSLAAAACAAARAAASRAAASRRWAFHSASCCLTASLQRMVRQIASGGLRRQRTVTHRHPACSPCSHCTERRCVLPALLATHAPPVHYTKQPLELTTHPQGCATIPTCRLASRSRW